MKRSNSIFTMSVLLLAGISTFVSCVKDDEQSVEDKTYHMTVTASKGDGNAKALAIDGTTISATWAVGETVTVYNVTKSADLTGTLAAQSSGDNTTLKGSLTGTIEAGDELLLKFRSQDYSMQQGTLEYIAANCDYAEATVTVASVAGGEITAEDEAAFENKQAIVKFTLMDAGGGAINASALSVSVGGTIYATVPATATNELYVALPGISGQAVTLIAKVGGQWYNKTQANVTFVNGQYYTVAAKLEQKGMLPGIFSVSSTSKVHFSQGNLQATYDGSSWTWAFAANQYDYIGNAPGNTTVTDSDPYISGTGTVDLFGWVGASSTFTGVAQYGLTSSSSETDYGNLATEALKSDWGTLPISNGGNAANSGWYTLGDSGEWQYLLNTRTASAVGDTANARYAKAYLFGTTQGLILFPDNYTHPSDVASPSFVNKKGNTNGWTANAYTAEEWAKMEAAGAVFLPAAGWRYEKSVTGHQGSGGLGIYHTSSPNPSSRLGIGSYHVYFNRNTLAPASDITNNVTGCSVRLVYPAE